LKYKTNNKRGVVDIACFDKPFNSRNADPVLIIETKAFSSELDYATEQAQNYAESYKSDSGNYANIVLVTNGYCYRAFKKENNNNSWKFFAKSVCAILSLKRGLQ